MDANSKPLVDIWAAEASASEPGELEHRCRQWLTPEEWGCAQRLRQPSSRNQHVVGRGMARKLLTLRTDFDPAEVVLAREEKGKPFVVAPQPTIRPFNVSHTEGMVLFAAVDCGPIGVDVERLSRKTDIGLAERYFAPAEVDYVHSSYDPEARMEAFFRVWTLKEAFIKAIGTGLTMPLGDFAFDQIEAVRPRVRMLKSNRTDDDGWHFISFVPKPGYIAAVAIRDTGGEFPPDLRLRRFETLLWPKSDPDQLARRSLARENADESPRQL
jgi:4'-phosphopantetheinyl transferase